MKKFETVVSEIKEEIKRGVYGASGERFISVRTLATQKNISYVTAYKVYNALKEKGYLILINNCWYITNGIIKSGSALIKNTNEKLIGIHANNIDNDYVTKIVESINEALQKEGIKTVISTGGNNPQSEKEILESFVKLGVSAVINFASTSKNLYGYYKRYPLPMVFIGRRIGETNLPCIRIDNFGSGRHLAEHLISCGYDKLYYIGPENYDDIENDRLSGFTAELKKQNIVFTEQQKFKCKLSNSNTVSILCNEIENSNKTAGIFCYNDLFAVAVLSELKKRKISVPENVGIIGYDNLPISKYITPQLSTITYNHSQIALSAIKMIDVIRMGKETGDIIIPNHITVRESTAKNNKKYLQL